MLRNIFFYIICVNIVQGQLNGDFWWLNGKLNNLLNVKPTLPKIEISDFQDEESSRIIFRDDDLFSNKLKPIRDRTSKLMPNNNVEENKVVWPNEEHMKSHDVEVFATESVNYKPIDIKPIKVKNKFDDVLIFSYPRNEKLVTVSSNKQNVEPTRTSTQNAIKVTETSTTAASFIFSELPTLSTIITKEGESQNICTYTIKKKCYQLNGFVYEYARRVPASSSKEPFICCILPVEQKSSKNNTSESIFFPHTNRYKRSDAESSIALKQRDFLLRQKFTSQRQQPKPVSTPLTKIVTPSEDDYADPYWNIKNTKPQPKPKGNTKYIDYSEDSHEYVDELPTPIVGLYSDHIPSPSKWPFTNGNKPFPYGGTDADYEEEEEDDDVGGTFGYSTIDPRQGTKKQRQKVKPLKLTTTSDSQSFDAERHTISYQSNPDFHVFQGFKLLNLFRNTSRVYTKSPSDQDQDKDVLVGSPDDDEEVAEDFNKEQFYENCGRVEIKKNNEIGSIGEAVSGSHPWLALVVLTKRQHNVLCYATLVHPRAAITVADCTEGTAPGDVTVIFGLWDLHERSRAKSRVATVHIHPGYKPGQVDNNLALLYWMRPLKLSGNIQPACLGRPIFGEDCKFFGWSGLDKGIQQPLPRWQRATGRLCSRHSNKRRASPSKDAFCVYAPRGIVTGLGGPLICEEDGHSSVVGIVVTRDNGYVLSPVRDWVLKMDSFVTGD